MNTPTKIILILVLLYNLVNYFVGTGWDAYEKKDYKTAHENFLISAEQGDAAAQYNLALMYDNGQGVPQNYKEAVKWYQLAAEQGFAYAQTNLGVKYDNGQGVPQDYNEAGKWYRLAAEQGVAQAQFNLGTMYYNGDGVPQDYVLAHIWLNIASSANPVEVNDESRVQNFSEKRNELEKKMTPQQIEKAQEMARNWKPKTSKPVYNFRATQRQENQLSPSNILDSIKEKAEEMASNWKPKK
jgi:TPR repeat protein